MKEITYDELKRLPKDSYELIDVRDEGLVAYGMIPGAINFYVEDLKGRDCYSLAEGYVGYVRAGMKREADREEKREKAEESIRKKFHKQLIRPLYLVRESDICAWRDYNDLHFLQCACHFTDTCTTCHEDGTTSSKRLETKKLIAELKKTNPFVESNIFRSMENVNLDTVIEYKKDGVRHHFLDMYDRNK